MNIDVLKTVSLFTILVGVMFGFLFSVERGRLPFTDPKFKVGDCITPEPTVGEFTTIKSDHFFLIKKVGDKSYLTTFYSTWNDTKRLVEDNYEQSIRIRDHYSQLVSPSECQTKE